MPHSLTGRISTPHEKSSATVVRSVVALRTNVKANRCYVVQISTPNDCIGDLTLDLDFFKM